MSDEKTTANHSETPNGSIKTTVPIEQWDVLWAALQEVGVALEPFLEADYPPSWAVSLSYVNGVANGHVETVCLRSAENAE